MSDPCACGTCASCGGSAALLERPVGDPQRFRHAAIRQRMLDSIASARVGAARPLAALGVRSTDDPAIALIDAYAGGLHVLAWNGARLGDDGTILRTKDRDALVDLARLIGYEPRPALSASTTLAFALETLPGAPERITVPKGAKVASVPGQNELPQVFETAAELEARGAWNAVRAVSPLPEIGASTTVVCAAGVTSAARAGDMLAVPFTPQTGAKDHWLIAQIGEAERVADPADPAKSYTRFHLIGTRTVETTPELAADRTGRVIILARRAAPFGATAPDARAVGEDVQAALGVDTDDSGNVIGWTGFEVGAPGAANAKTIDLDASYPEAFKDRLVLLARSTKHIIPTKRHEFEVRRKHKVKISEIYSAEKTALEYAEEAEQEAIAFAAAQVTAPTLTRITAAEERARTGFLLSAKISRITLETIDLTRDQNALDAASTSLRYLVRELAVHIETESLELLRPPLDVVLPAPADRLTLPGKIELPPGRRVVLAGETWSAAGVPSPRQAEVAVVKSVQFNGDGTTTVFFETDVAMRFRSLTLDLLGNCVSASHGETPASGTEIIGSGKAGARDQRFALKGKPLSYVPAESPRGYAPALEVRVGGRAWSEAANLMDLSEADRAYTVRMSRDGQAVVQLAGRLPSGLNNVTALYRTGGGTGGNLDPGRITMAMSPVLGVKAITNPVRADGGSAAETVEDIRRSAPMSVRTLDKVVSLADYEAFAATYRGVGKALATLLYAGMRQVVCLTLADSELRSPDPHSDIVTGLKAELARVAVPGRAVRIAGFTSIHPLITLAFAHDPSFRRADIEAALRTRLGEAFGAAARPFARALHRSEVLAVAQGVEGVVAAGLAVFALPPGQPLEADGRLACPGPSLDPQTGQFSPAGLLSIDPAQVLFGEMQP